MGKWKQELEEILKEETDMGRDMIPKYARCYARIILENFISQEIEKAREEGFKEGEEYGYQEGYHQGLRDIIIDTYYHDKEFQYKLTTK